MAKPSKAEEKPLVVRLEGVHRRRVREIQDHLGIDNPPDAVRVAIKEYVERLRPPALPEALAAAIDDRIQRAFDRQRSKAWRKNAIPRVEERALAAARQRHAVAYARAEALLSAGQIVPYELGADINRDARLLRAHGESARNAPRAPSIAKRAPPKKTRRA